MKYLTWIGAGLATIGLSGCVVAPQGPTYAALPGSGKTYQAFVADDTQCRQVATAQTGGAAENATSSMAASAVAGSAIGAVAGLALGDRGSAAAAGAGIGLLFGAASGAGASQTSYYATQQRYDTIYSQCMYAAGNRVAMTGQFARRYQQAPIVSAPAPVAQPPAAPTSTNAPPGYEPSASIPPPNAPPPR